MSAVGECLRSIVERRGPSMVLSASSQIDIDEQTHFAYSHADATRSADCGGPSTSLGAKPLRRFDDTGPSSC
jgi:hypothetical protein